MQSPCSDLNLTYTWASGGNKGQGKSHGSKRTRLSNEERNQTRVYELADRCEGYHVAHRLFEYRRGPHSLIREINGLRGHTGCPTAYCKEAEAYQINIKHPTTNPVQHRVAPRPSPSSSGSSSATGLAHQRTGAGLALPNYQWIIEKLCVCPAEVVEAQSPITTISSSSSVLPPNPPHPPIKTRAAVIDLTTDSSSDGEDDENEVSHVGNSSSSSSTVKLRVNETKAAKKRDTTLSAIFDHNIDSLVDADPYSTKRKAKLPSLPVPTDGIYPPLINIPQITTRVLQPLRAKLNAALEKSKSNSIYGYNPESIAIPMWPRQHCGHCNKWGIGSDDDACPDCSCDIVECYDYAGLTDAVCKVCFLLHVYCVSFKYTCNISLIYVYATLLRDSIY